MTEIEEAVDRAVETVKTLNTRVEDFDPNDLLLLERNARFMPSEQFRILVENIERDGCLSSVPFACREEDGQYRVLSGNHRVMAAVAARLDSIKVMVVDEVMSDEQRVAIQLSHNAIAGQDDPTMLLELFQEIDNIDWRGYSGLDDFHLQSLMDIEVEPFSEVKIDFQSLMFLFLKSEMDDVDRVMKEALTFTSGAGDRWLARFEDHDRLLKALETTYKAHHVRNVGTGLTLILDVFESHVHELSDVWVQMMEDGHWRPMWWTPIASVVGYDMPPDASLVFKQAVDTMIARAEITHPWQALEFWAAEYLAGP